MSTLFALEMQEEAVQIQVFLSPLKQREFLKRSVHKFFENSNFWIVFSL